MTPYLYGNPAGLRPRRVTGARNRPAPPWTVAAPADRALARTLYGPFCNADGGRHDVPRAREARRGWMRIDARVEQKVGR